MTIYKSKRLGQYVCYVNYNGLLAIGHGLTRIEAMNNAFKGVL